MRNEPKNRLLRPKSESLVPVRMDVFCHDSKVLADVREALEQDLKPVTFALIGDSVVLRLERKPLQTRKPTSPRRRAAAVSRGTQVQGDHAGAGDARRG